MKSKKQIQDRIKKMEEDILKGYYFTAYPEGLVSALYWVLEK